MSINEEDAMLRAIRAKCQDCMGGSREMAAKCGSKKCSLWPWRAAESVKARYAFGETGVQTDMLGMGERDE